MPEVDFSWVLEELRPIRDFGGKLIYITGMQGSGKTTLMAKLADVLGLKYRMRVLWRGIAKGQVFKYVLAPKVILIHEQLSELRPYMVGETTFKELRWYDLPGVEAVEQFSTPEELEGLALQHSDAIFVVYMPREVWRTFLAYWPIWRQYAYWTAVFIDEFEQIAPHHPQGELWSMLLEVADGIAEFRKTDTYIVACSQQPKDVFYLVRDKFQYRIILKGTKLEDSITGLSQNAVNALEQGEGFIYCGLFYRFPFKPIRPLIDFAVAVRAKALF